MRVFANLIGAGIALLLTGAAWAGTLAWKSRGPQPRINTAMAYDSSRHAALMFGGQVPAGVSNYSYLSDTWVWTTTTWQKREVAGPSARSAHAMAYDAARGVTVLFGGTNGASSNGETWEWNGASWTQRNIAGPSARSGAKMCFDSNRNVIVLFGGTDAFGSLMNDTWEYDGSAWTQRSAPGQLGRSGFAFAFDSVRGVAVMYGGWRYMTAMNFTPIQANDTWTWNGTVWTQMAVTGPQAMRDAAAAFDTSRGVFVLNGGQTSSTSTKQTWEWNGTTWTKRTDGAIGRYGHAMVYVPENGGVLIYGGWPVSNNVSLGDMKRWNGTNWADVSLYPGARANPVMAFQSARHSSLMALGHRVLAGVDTLLTDGLEWDGNVWLSAGIAGPGAFSGGMVYDSARAKAVHFGGQNNQMALTQKTYEYAGPGTWSLRSSTGPSPRQFPAMAYDSARGVTVLFGGMDQTSNPVGETWEWDGTAWTQRLVISPVGRYAAMMAYDAGRGVTVMFGGANNFGFYGETWEWNGVAWALRTSSGPSARSAGAMAYDSARGKIVLYGGTPAEVSDTWEWDGSTWTQIPITGPTACVAIGMAYDSDRQVMVVFGGHPPFPSDVIAETWELAVVCPADLNADHVVDDADFVKFAAAYDILDCADPTMALGCPADLNGDLVVDDSDFVIFANAYDALLCW